MAPERARSDTAVNRGAARAVTAAMDIHATRLASGTEDPKTHTPAESLLLAYAAMVPLVAAAVAVLAMPRDAGLVTRLAVDWAGALLCFFAGVNRGLSFRQPGGPALVQVGTMLWLFVVGMAAILSPWPSASLVLELAGFASMAVLDPAAARHREAPRYFARLRPVQLLLPLGSLAVLLWRVVSGA